MKPSEQQSRISLTELKGQIEKKLGLERSRQYFYYLNSFLGYKCSKEEFDKLCSRILGRENLPLHNQLITSILKNVSHAKVPPPIHGKEVPAKSTTALFGKKTQTPSTEDGQNNHIGRPSTTIPMPTLGIPAPPVWLNGDILPMSPRKSRSGIRDRRLKDRPSPLGPNGKTDAATSNQLNSVANDSNVKVSLTENGELRSCDYERTLQHHQGHAQQPENEHDVSLLCSTGRPQINSWLDPVSLHSKGPVGPRCAENRIGVQPAGDSMSIKSPLRAPLGIPFCSASLGGTRRSSSTANHSSYFSSLVGGQVCDNYTLNKRMEQIARAQGLEGVSTNCANLLNNGLDVYLKRLIRSCIKLVGTRSGHQPLKQPVYNYRQQPNGKLMNGIWPGHQLQVQSSSGVIDGMQESKTQTPISMLDFKVAMELNPQQLGEDWPLLLEKICMHTCEE